MSRDDAADAIARDDLEALERALASMSKEEIAAPYEEWPLMHQVLQRRQDRRFDGNPAVGTPMIDALLAHGADPNVQQAEEEDDLANRTALYQCLMGDADVEAFERLLLAGADPDIVVTDHGSSTPLREMCMPPLDEVLARLAPVAAAGPELTVRWALASEAWEEHDDRPMPPDVPAMLELRPDGEATMTVPLSTTVVEGRWEATAKDGLVLTSSAPEWLLGALEVKVRRAKGKKKDPTQDRLELTLDDAATGSHGRVTLSYARPGTLHARPIRRVPGDGRA